MENSITFLFFFSLILGAMSAPNRSPVVIVDDLCPTSWDLFGDHCYKYISSPKRWIDAELQCLSEGGNLVSIHNQAEERFVKNLIRNIDASEPPTWIGLRNFETSDGPPWMRLIPFLRDRVWLWSDGSKVDFTLWNPGEPNNSGGIEDCVHTNWGKTKNWNDKDCSESYAFVCSARLTCGVMSK